jgi:type IV secretory pathway VirD2 relaxase
MQSRRVVIKTRLVRIKSAGSRAALAHLHYITRDGVTRNGEPSQAYDARSDAADLGSFEARGRADRHQFRFIVAPEDAAQLEDLRGFTRDLMTRMEADVGTRLDWVAVDHWNTDNPHTHVVLRGKDEAGRDIIIAREYVSHGLRSRASELATEMLGTRTEREIRASMEREVAQERWTGVDHELHRRSRDGTINLRDLPASPHGRYRRSVLLSRLQRLTTMGLADELAPGSWRLRPDAEQTLRSLAERGDIIRTMQRALHGAHRELVIFDAARATSPVVGRVAAKGLIDELTDRAYIIVDAVDGRAHHVALAAGTDRADLPIGAIIEARGTSRREADRRIAALAEHGVYSTRVHLTELRRTRHADRDPEAIVEGHVRRLEALRRAGIVERLGDGLWRIPADLPARGRTFDRRNLGGCTIELLSHLPIERQVSAIGATWLDRQLMDGDTRFSELGFGSVARHAIKQREDFLVDHGFAERRNSRVVLDRNLLSRLRDREIHEVAKRLAGETGLTHRPLAARDHVEGVYRRSLLLATGKFAMLDDGLGFTLVPWRPVIEKRLGQNVAAILRGDVVSWHFGRKLTR